MYRFIFLLLLLFFSELKSQEFLKGEILVSEKNIDKAVEGVNLYWLNSDTGTITNDQGKFKIKFTGQQSKLVISYLGYVNDTITIKDKSYIKHYLTNSGSESLEEVTVTRRRRSSKRTFLMPQNIIMISDEELLKAACCNLSESFETNPSVDVNHNDAITGTKQIEMLGLKSPYILITEENIPMVRGASQTFGLGFTPGTWIESIQVTKGMGSVTNGYESIAGQINYEIKKPFSDMPFFFNLFNSIDGRIEANAHVKSKWSEKLQNTTFIHYNDRKRANDKNGDLFLDKPIQDQINLLSKWQFTDASNGLVSFLNIRYLDDNKKIGSVDFNEKSDLSRFWGRRNFYK